VEPVPFLWAMGGGDQGMGGSWFWEGAYQAKLLPPTEIDSTMTRVSSWR
jgi:hypothetical protein